ncbi:unnamed protein product [Ilex paraguariensis]|uniref:Uncharacterized protein n=1 Tax=Ilex paraguariensis TaxID=185542 RepID=A0ABC8U398_9AQUA
MEELSNKKRLRDDSDESPEVKRLREDILNDLDDPDQWTGTEDLDLFMKIFEEEISGFSSCVNFENLTSDSGELLQLDLVDLLEASDDELGLPPPSNTSTIEVQNPDDQFELVRDSSELSELWWFDDQITSYNWIESSGIGGTDGQNTGNSECVGFDELFDYSDLGSAYLLWRFETLPAQENQRDIL